MRIVGIIFILVSLISASLAGQNCCTPSILFEDYEKDIKHLALSRMVNLNAPEQNLIDIDPVYQDTIWDAFSAIFHSTSIGRDDVFDEFCLHHDIWSSSEAMRISNEIDVRLDPMAPWFQNWVSGDITTNNSVINSLTQKYGFDQVIFSTPIIDVFTLTTNQYINLNAFADSLATDTNIIFAERKLYFGGSTKITYQRNGGSSTIEFSAGYGDCQSGCQLWHTWSFLVDFNCDVIYLGTSGDPNMAPPQNCNLTDSLPMPELSLSLDTFCVNETMEVLIGGAPVGGEYSGAGITNNVLNPTAAGLGSHLVTYTIEDSAGCLYSTSQEIVVNAESCLSTTRDLESLQAINLFPNPSNGEIFIELEAINNNLEIQLFDIQGTLILERKPNSTFIQLTDLKPGIFLLKLSDNNVNDIRKIVVN